MTSISAATAATTAAPAATTASGQSALGSLTNNYQTFLKMLTTQLQNQDPSNPMDSNQFTSELVQFSGVEQQINTNSNLNQMIQLLQGNNVLQSSQILGKTVEATSASMPLQQGTGQINFTAPTAGPVAVSVYDSKGKAVYTAAMTATQGANHWTWQGQTASGATAPDGSYTVSVGAVAADGSTTALPFTILGKATSVQQQNGAVEVLLGALPVNMTSVVAVHN